MEINFIVVTNIAVTKVLQVANLITGLNFQTLDKGSWNNECAGDLWSRSILEQNRDALREQYELFIKRGHLER
jgi:hypothetical protein